MVDGRTKQSGGYSFAPEVPVNHEAGDRPHRNIIDWLGHPGALQSSEIRTRPNRYPADWVAIGIGQQTRDRPVLNQSTKQILIWLALALLELATRLPIPHAPTTALLTCGTK